MAEVVSLVTPVVISKVGKLRAIEEISVDVEKNLGKFEKELARVLEIEAGGILSESSISKSFEEIAEFRAKKGLPEYSAKDGSSGTIAKVTIGENTFYGANSTSSVYGLSIEERRTLFSKLISNGKLVDPNTGVQIANLGRAEFLSHAEAEALINASKSGKSLPKIITLFVDRPTCATSCKKYLGDLLDELGVEQLNIYWKNQTNAPFVITKK